MRIAIFGGSFNPPHVAHQLVCTHVLATARPSVDRVLMVPTFKHPFDKQLAPYEDRVKMCELAAEPFCEHVAVSRIEEELGGESYTLRTVQALSERHPNVEYALVIGADLLEERARWHKFDELEKLVPFIVVGRVGHPGPGGVELPNVSSTEVRERLRRGESIDHLVAAGIEDYIAARRLYRT
jgi:nicotinate-nucleotide adenylyltransferase